MLIGLISGILRDVAQICALVGHYAAYSGNSLRRFRDNLSHLQESRNLPSYIS
jgi:hypothetical protein